MRGLQRALLVGEGYELGMCCVSGSMCCVNASMCCVAGGGLGQLVGAGGDAADRGGVIVARGERTTERDEDAIHPGAVDTPCCFQSHNTGLNTLSSSG